MNHQDHRDLPLRHNREANEHGDKLQLRHHHCFQHCPDHPGHLSTDTSTTFPSAAPLNSPNSSQFGTARSCLCGIAGLSNTLPTYRIRGTDCWSFYSMVTGTSTAPICSWIRGTGTAPSICVLPWDHPGEEGGPLDVGCASRPPVDPDLAPSVFSNVAKKSGQTGTNCSASCGSRGTARCGVLSRRTWGLLDEDLHQLVHNLAEEHLHHGSEVACGPRGTTRPVGHNPVTSTLSSSTVKNCVPVVTAGRGGSCRLGAEYVSRSSALVLAIFCPLGAACWKDHRHRHLAHAASWRLQRVQPSRPST